MNDTSTLRNCFEAMTLINLNNWCYANTAVLTLMWTVLTCRSFSISDLGPQSARIVHFLQTASDTPIHLPDVMWFNQLLNSWPTEGEQCDPVEFLTHIVTGLELPRINWSRERRVQIGRDFSVRDKSDRFNPITLYIDPEQAHNGWIRLDTMINTWHHYMGMHTALLQQSSVICLHIDRHVLAGNGDTYKSDLSIGMHGVFALPFFCSNQMDIEWHDFRMVAAIAHLGDDQAGHRRAILCTQADYSTASQPVMALLTDDNAPPTTCWSEPRWFSQNVMCIWLCALDDLALHQLARTHAHVQPAEIKPQNLNALLRQFE